MNTILLIILGAIILWIIITYNNIIKLKNYAKKAYAGIDIQLKRRTNLIPNLVETVKGYAKHEKKLLEDITKMRTELINAQDKKDIKKVAGCDEVMDSKLKTLFAVAENYPTLKANENFLKLQDELIKTEDQIAASRRIYNANTTEYNTKIQTMPSNIIAKLFGFKDEQLYEATNTEKKNIEVKLQS
ncbi:MAG: LemA family protein [Candidatus Woesearchaeota archaeon]